MNIGALYATLGLNTTAFTAGMKKAQMTMATTGKSMRTAGKSMSLYLSAGLAVVGAAAFSMGKDFEASMAKIGGLVGVAADQVDKWGKEILRIAPQLGKAPKELADALFFVTSAGIKGAEAMDVLKMSAQASAVGLGETKIVADLVTSAMNAYGKETLDAAAATDILVTTVREGKAEASDLAGAMGQVLPIASAMGVQFHEVGAAIAGMTRTGTEASTASMQLKNILASILKPSQQAAKALKGYGTSAAEIRRTIKEDGLLAAMQKLIELTGGESDELAKLFPNIRALSGFLDLMGSNIEDNVTIFDKLTKSTGNLKKALEITEKTAMHKWNQSIAEMKTAMTTLGLTVAQTVTPMLQGLGKAIGDLGRWFGDLSESQKKLTMQIALFAAALGPVLLLLGGLFSAISAIAGGIVALISPLGIIIAAIALLAGGLYLVYANIGKLNGELITNEERLHSLGGTLEDFNSNLADESVALYQLFSALKQTNPGTEMRKILIDKINTLYGEYLPNLLTEKMTLQDIAIAEEAAGRAMRARLAEKFKLEKINAILETQMEREQQAMKNFASEKAPLSSWMAALNEYLSDSNWVVNESGKIIGKTTAEMDELAKATGYSYNQLVSLFDGMSTARRADKKVITELIALYESYASLAPPPTSGPTSTTEAGKGGKGGGTTDKSGILDDLQFEISLLGKAEAIQRAMSIARQNDIELGGEQYNEILKLTTAIQTHTEAAEAAAEAELKTAAAREKIIGQVEQIQEGLLTEEEAIRAFYDNKILIIEDAVNQEVISRQKANEIIQQLEKEKQNAIDKTNDKSREAITVQEALGSVMAQTLAATGRAFGKMIAEQKAGWRDLVGVMLQAIQAIVMLYLAESIAAMIANESTKGLIGLAFAAVGIAAIIALFGAFVMPNIEGMAKGGSVTKAGNFLIGEEGPELLNLPVGAAVTPMNKVKAISTGYGGGNAEPQLIAQVTGSQLDFVLEHWYEQKNRIQ